MNKDTFHSHNKIVNLFIKYLEVIMEFKKSKKFNKKHDFNLSIDNLAIPEIHTHKQDDTLKATKDQPSVNYDTAIPEIHIKKKKQ